METVSTNLRGAVHENVDAALRPFASEATGSGGGGGPLGVCGAASRLASFAAYCTPGSDGWAIFDPVVVVGGSSVGVDMGEVEFSAGKTVTCHVWKDSGGVAHAKMTSGEWSLPDKSELLASVPIVRVTDPDRMGGVEQIHTGVIHLNGTGDGGSAVPKPFDIVSESDGETGETVSKVVRCFIPCPVEVVTASDYVISGDSPVYLHISRSTSGYTATVDQESRARSATHVQYKLYELADGKPTLDCRPTVIPIMEF